MKKFLSVLLSCSMLLVGLAACSSSTDDEEETVETVELTAGGSTSVQPLMELIAEAFEEAGYGTITVEGGGSSVGTQGAIDGTFDVGMASRALKDEELEYLEETIIALDGIAVIVNTENTAVTDLTIEQLYGIFTGEITNWSEVGGEDAEITVVAREEGSGTRDGFESVVGFDSEELVESAEIQNSTGAVVTSVSGNTNAIGYISLGSLTDEVSAVTVEGVEASEDTILDGTYLLQRPFVLATLIDSDVADTLFDFIFSDEGAAIISENGYVPVDAEE